MSGDVFAMKSTQDLAKDKIEELVEKYERARKAGELGNYTESDTITNFFLSLLDALGWNIYDVHEVKQQGYPRDFRSALPVEYRPNNMPDCIISVNRKPYAVFEFKRLGLADVDKPMRANKLMTKAEYLDTKYVVLSNFTHTIIYARTMKNPKN